MSESIDYRQWGEDIDEKSKEQMRDACALPVSRAAALMPDAHLGYGLPIGGVLATENAVIPYAVGVDIACRMRMTITDLPVKKLAKKPEGFDRSLTEGTVFGVGKTWKKRQRHAVLDRDWDAGPVTRQLKDKAWAQLGTSGSGNHFCEWGLLEVHGAEDAAELGVEPGEYVALLSHSGSRGAGATICAHYSKLATELLPPGNERFKRLAWLGLDTAEGQEYWHAMNLMGHYAAANHEVIHENVVGLAGAEALGVVENHHNFAWEEEHEGRRWIVHRKGATPAGAGVLGVIPGNMADPAFVVRGKGNAASLDSAAHGAGRRMSRTAAKKKYDWNSWRGQIGKRGVRLLAAGLDEVPGVYKDIHQVMADQTDLVETVARFHPKVVLMCGDGSRAED